MNIGRVLTKSHRKHQRNRFVFCKEIYWRTTIEAKYEGNDRWWGLRALGDLLSGLSGSRIWSALDLRSKPQRLVQNSCRIFFYRCISLFLRLRRQRTPGIKSGNQQCAIVYNTMKMHDTWYRAGLFALVTSHPAPWPTPNTGKNLTSVDHMHKLTPFSQSFNF